MVEFDPATSVTISLIVPAYNEARRLPPYLETIHPYLSEQFGEDFEVIVVDDGSNDGLAETLRGKSCHWPQLKVIQHAENRGKGAAVRTGMLAAKGELLLFADADGATPIEEERRLRAAIGAGADVAVGSRLVDGTDVARQRSWPRALIGRAFAAVARRLFGLRVRDTQCGFKMFRGEAGRRLFGLVEETGYLFDLELLTLADKLGCRVAEVPINWSDVPDSRLSMLREWRRIVAGLWRLRRRRAKLLK